MYILSTLHWVLHAVKCMEYFWLSLPFILTNCKVVDVFKFNVFYRRCPCLNDTLYIAVAGKMNATAVVVIGV